MRSLFLSEQQDKKLFLVGNHLYEGTLDGGLLSQQSQISVQGSVGRDQDRVSAGVVLRPTRTPKNL